MKMGLVVMLLLLGGCVTSTARHRVREPVSLHEDEFTRAMKEVVQDVHPPSRPLKHARALMFDDWQREVYLEWTARGLEPAIPDSQTEYDASEPDEITRGYLRWCEAKNHPGDCFSLLKETSSLDAEGRYTLAMAIATDAVWSETKQELAGMANPMALRASVASAMALYLMLWILPEPVSKGVAATLTAALIAYLGVDTVWGLIGGWMQLIKDVNRAETFDHLRSAGERYGQVMGKQAARAFVLLATAAIGNTAGLVTKVPGLPGYAQAARLAETPGGFRLAALGEVRSVAVSADGTFTIALAPGTTAAMRPESGVGTHTESAPAHPASSDDVNVRPPAGRHYAQQVDQRTLARDTNSVIEPRVDVKADIAAMKEGHAQMGRTASGEVSYTVNGRTYGVHPNGTLYPLRGDGIHTLDRGAFKALGVYNQFGNTPRAAQILDSMRIGPAERMNALDVWKTYQ